MWWMKLLIKDRISIYVVCICLWSNRKSIWKLALLRPKFLSNVLFLNDTFVKEILLFRYIITEYNIYEIDFLVNMKLSN